MSRSAQRQISSTKNIKHPNHYIQALHKEDWAIDEEMAVSYKGRWRALFDKNLPSSLHLEIGCGNGKHFSSLCLKAPQDCFLAIELKYKPLIQTIRRVTKNSSKNGRVIRYNARWIDNLFEPEELNHVYIHFPDPWLKKRRSKKHQLIQPDFCRKLYQIQKANSFLELKTDSKDYFEQSVREFKKAGYKLEKYNSHLYKQDRPVTDHLSQFELIFVQKNIPIKYSLFRHP
ncbi:MAG: tRNA (guanosine(46)-N7)-methyltransferase TrmB [Oligoflexia bacterium]|nr:tRNA (guanosine(46)-N7)-methyltransferase TrmB [Oligoflexia bacterium]